MSYRGPTTDYTEEKAALVIKALRAGRRPGSAALLVNVARATLYAWRDERADFATAWEEATAYAADKMEEVVYDLGLGGDLAAAAYWLKHRKPERFDRSTWVKLSIMEASLKAAQANGNKRVTFEIGPDGMPVPVAAEEDDDLVREYIPDNGRGDGSPPGG
jgi:hypothetical protein